jgi:hypothetical protein
VIIGFSAHDTKDKALFEYDDVRGTPHPLTVTRINPYLVEADNVLLSKRSTPVGAAMPIQKGSEATDFGHLFFSDEERANLISREPAAEKWLLRCYGGDELLNSDIRWCLWLVGCTPSDLRKMKEVANVLALVATARKNSGKARTQDWADRPALFTENRQPTVRYLAIPKVSSERRNFLPVAFLEPDCIATGSLLTIPGAGVYEFGVISSSMHLAWLAGVGGRMKSDFQYSAGIVYNNFPWPGKPSATARSKIEEAAQAVLDARSAFPESTLADLYDPLSMPPALVKAHQRLDAAVDAAYGRRTFKSDAERVAYLFGLYQEYTSLLPSAPAKSPRNKASKRA